MCFKQFKKFFTAGFRRGQATIEYVLMLATIAVLVSAFFTAFNTRIVRWIFAFIGRIVMGK